VIQGNMFNPRQSYRKPSSRGANPMSTPVPFMGGYGRPAAAMMGLAESMAPRGAFGGGAPTPYNGPASDDRLLPEQAYYMRQQNPFTPGRMQGTFAGNVPLAAAPTFQQRSNAAMAGSDQALQTNRDFLARTPIPSGSLGSAAAARGMTSYNPIQAGAVNGYIGQYGQAAAPGRPGAQGPTVFDPTNLAARFGGAPAVSQATLDANARMARTQASDALLAGKLASGQTIDSAAQGGVYAKRTADGGMAYTNKAGAVEGIYPDLRNPMKRSQALEKLQAENPNLYQAYQADQGQRADKAAMTKARAQKFKDEHGGMSARQFGIQSRQDKREQARFKRDVMRGLNPMSPDAMALHPNAAKAFQQGGAKPTMQNPIAPGKTRTTQSMADADTVMTSLATADPFISSLGARGKDDTSIASVNAGLQGLKDSGVQPSPEHLRSLRAYAQAVKHRAAPGQDPWDVYAPQVYDELVSMPDDATDEDLTNWWEKYKQRPNMGNAAAAGPPAGNMPYFPPGTPIGR